MDFVPLGPAYFIGKLIWKDAHKNILSFAASQGNAGYFGIPVAILLFGKDVLGIYVLLWLGGYIWAFTGGYLIVAHGKHPFSESLKKLVKIPVFYSFLFALILKFLEIKVGNNILEITDKFTGAITIFGMMIIGLNLSSLNKTSLDWKFTLLALASRAHRG